MYILGISCYYHDAAVALLKDGELVAAAMEERFSRKKHDNSFPKQAKNIGFFALPGADPYKNGLTLWMPGAIYIPQTTKGAKLAAAKKFLDFVASPPGCEVQNKALPPAGPCAWSRSSSR